MRARLPVAAFAVIVALLVAIMTMLTPGVSRANAAWQPAKIMAQLKAGTNQVIISHRGIARKYCPENSTCAIKATYDNNIEAIELDARQSAEGTPWLFHDDNAGRMLSHSPQFNIFQTGQPLGWNPEISSMHDAELTHSFLRDFDFDVTGYHALSLQGALSFIRANSYPMVVVVDLRSVDAVSRAATIVNSLGMQGRVVLKFSASLIRDPFSQAFAEFTKGVPFATTMYAGDIEAYADSRPATCAQFANPVTRAHCQVQDWASQFASRPNFKWLEIGNKAPVSGDPTYFLVQYALANRISIGGFQPVPVYPAVPSGTQRVYVRSNGTCCSALNDYLTPASDYFPAETADLRENIDNEFSQGFGSVITDNPLGAIAHAPRRNTALYY